MPVRASVRYRSLPSNSVCNSALLKKVHVPVPHIQGLIVESIQEQIVDILVPSVEETAEVVHIIPTSRD